MTQPKRALQQDRPSHHCCGRDVLGPGRTKTSAYGPGQGTFLNVDLDVAAPCDLTPLMKALDRRLLVLHSNLSPRRSFIVAELVKDPKSADDAIVAIARKLSSLRGEARRLWAKCTCRSFNIGYESPSRRPELVDAISGRALDAVSRVGGTVAITVYPHSDESPTASLRRSAQGKSKRKSRKRSA